jgi:exonuclease SbcD
MSGWGSRFSPVRLLHTSDWHIGRNLNLFDLSDAQTQFIDHIIEVVKTEKIDAVLISGDIYDRALPSLDAIATFEYALKELSALTKVIITSGNHDGARRLGFASSLLEGANIYIKTRIEDIDTPVLVSDEKKTIAIYGIPYLEPFTSSSKLITNPEEAKKIERSHQGVLSLAINRINADRTKTKHDHAVVMAHAWFTGGETDGSEIDLSVGGIGNAPTSLLKNFDYAALGHIHRPQVIENHIRYSGSALHYSFKGAKSKRLTYIVDFSSPKPVISEVFSPTYRELTELEDSMDNFLRLDKYAEFENHFLKIKLTDKPAPLQPMAQLRARFPWVVELTTLTGTGELPKWEEIRDKSDFDICCDFLDDVRGAAPNEWEIEQLRSAIDKSVRGLVGDESLELEKADSE